MSAWGLRYKRCLSTWRAIACPSRSPAFRELWRVNASLCSRYRRIIRRNLPSVPVYGEADEARTIVHQSCAHSESKTQWVSVSKESSPDIRPEFRSQVGGHGDSDAAGSRAERMADMERFRFPLLGNKWRRVVCDKAAVSRHQITVPAPNDEGAGYGVL